MELRTERRKSVAEPGFSVRVGFQSFPMNRPIRFQLRPHAGEDWASSEPHADATRDEAKDQIHQIDKAHAHLFGR